MPRKKISARRRRLTLEPAGLQCWMKVVAVERERARVGLTPQSVHQLRRALRRCLSMADGVTPLDPHPEWPQMRRAAKKLFKRLGRLRDLHVMKGWAKKYLPGRDKAVRKLLERINAGEPPLARKAGATLESFDAAQWERWRAELGARADRLPRDSETFRAMARENYEEAYELHRKAEKKRAVAAYHKLRIGVKRFRYIVENFLPGFPHAKSLKEVQDYLGEFHDLCVLEERLGRGGKNLLGVLEREKEKRLAAYRRRACGPRGLWRRWRAALKG